MRPTIPLAAAGLLLLSCATPGPEMQVELLLYDEPVQCDAALGSCSTLSGLAVRFEEHRVQGYMSRAASRFRGGGMYLHFEFERPTGAVAVVDLDVPTTGSGGASDVAQLVYKEFTDGRRTFMGHAVFGTVQVPADPGCLCQDGRLELVFTDRGADGKAGTADDKVRRLSMGRFSQVHSCRGVKVLDIAPVRGTLITALGDCPVSHSSVPKGGSGGGGGYDHYHGEYDHGCYAAEPDYYNDDAGCEGDTVDDDWGADEGCGGDTVEDDWGDAEGCEGDSSGGSSDYGSEGCEGDSSDSASADISCEGDAHAATTRARRRGGSRWSGAVGFMLPVGLALLITARRRRRRRR